MKVSSVGAIVDIIEDKSVFEAVLTRNPEELEHLC